MIINFLQRLLWLVALVAAQMVVFNYVHLFGYATPLPFVYLLLLFPLGTERWSILLWGFACGLLTDITALTLGIGAAAMTLTAFIQPPVLAAMAPRDAVEDLQPGIATMGFWGYFRYAALLSFVFAAAYFLLQAFTFFHAAELAVAFASSWVLTLFFLMIFEVLRTSAHRR